MAAKENALSKLPPPSTPKGRFKPEDSVLAFLRPL